MKRFLLLALLSLGILSTGFSQDTPTCGLSVEYGKQILQRLIENKEILARQPIGRREAVNIPIKFHLVAETDGSGRALEKDVLEQLCALNEDFSTLDMHFFIKDGFNYMNNSVVFNDHGDTRGGVMQASRDNSAINIWVVRDADPPSGNARALGYYDPQFDWIVIRTTQINGSSKTLTHELGHFFSLNHPFFGWDGEAYDPSRHGSPVQPTSPAGIPTEKMDGSNCNNAGDFICDTPPDYNFAIGTDCELNETVLDPDSIPVNPDELLFMTWNLDRCLQRFSEQQKQLMRTDYMRNNRNYLRRAAVPDNPAITDAPSLIFPIDGEEAPDQGGVTLEWEPVDGADQYLVEVSLVPNFSPTLDPINLIVENANTVTVSGLEKDRTYFWRVRPFTDMNTCPRPTEEAAFKVGETVAVNEIAVVSSWSLSPNPVKQGDRLRFSLNSREAFNGALSIYSSAGQLLQQLPQRRFNAGTSSLYLPTDRLAPGFYLLSLQSEIGQINQRVVITR